MSEHADYCGIGCECGYDSPPCRTCNCGVDEHERVMQIANELMIKWRDTLDWLAAR